METTSLRFRANLSRVNDKWYVCNVFMYAEGEQIDVDTVEVSGDVYLYLFRQLGGKCVNSAHKLRLYIDDGVDYVATVDQVHESPVSISANGVEDFELDEVKHTLKYNVRRSIADKTQLLAIVMFNYMRLNNELIAAGFCITEANREEVYLKIINTGDIQLIDKLSAYLDAYDELSAGAKYVDIYNDAVRVINSARTVDELNKVYADKVAPTLCEVS